jgi:tRNA A-37 threonylcarbamoyl transferase component Bud32
MKGLPEPELTGNKPTEARMTRTIEDRLIEWEERKEQGEAVSATDLCRDAPALLPELARLIGLLASAEHFLDVNATVATAAKPPRPPARPLAKLPGHIGRYEVRAELGRGATSVVYRAWDPELWREVALKVLHEERPLAGIEQAARVARFEREARTLAQLRHEHIVPIYEPGLLEGRPYFVLEYVRGGSLRDRLAQLSAAGPRAFVPLLHQVACAVQHAHECRILHRDLKPANILLADDGRALVTDFGLAKLLADAPSPEWDAADTVLQQESEDVDVSTRLTATGFQPGTPAYMAPEQYNPAFGAVGPATDVWALGVILYELLTGVKPFRGAARDEVRVQVCGGQLVRPCQQRPGTDRRLDRIVRRCLQTDPQRRYQTAGEFAGALAVWQTRRRLRRGLAIGALLAGLVVLGTVAWIRETSPERRYLRAAAVHEDALKRNQSVQFIPVGATQTLAYAVRAGEQSTTLAQTDDGLLVDGRAKCCLVELCPRVPLEHYRLQAKVRLKKVLAGDGAWGVYLNYNAVNTVPGPQHYYEVVCFRDSAGLAPAEWGLRQGPGGIRATLSQRWFSYYHPSLADATGRYPYRNVTGNANRTKSEVNAAVPEGDWAATWRTIQIDVHGSEVSARCGGGGLTQELDLGAIRNEERAGFLATLPRLFPDLRDFDLTVSGTGAGVYVDTNVCTVGEFVIAPLPAP